MVARLLVLAQRAALLVALAASAALWVDYRSGPAGAFCGTASGCARVRESAYSAIAGVPLPLVGLVTFALLFVAALWLRPRYRVAFVALSVAVALGAVVLIALQMFVVRALCAWCMAADAGAIVAALATLLTVRGAPAEEAPRRAVWTGVGILATLVPLSWSKPIAQVAALPPELEALVAPASVDVVQFTDFECPFCRQLHATLEQIRHEQPDLAVARLMVPLEQHPGARPAALAYLCTPEPNREAMAQKLYAAESIDAGATAAFAREIGLEPDAFQLCLADPRTAQAIDQHLLLFQSAGLSGLPSTFVERQLIKGAREEDLREAIARAKSGSGGLGIGWMIALLLLLFGGAAVVSLRGWAADESAEADGEAEGAALQE